MRWRSGALRSSDAVWLHQRTVATETFPLPSLSQQVHRTLQKWRPNRSSPALKPSSSFILSCSGYVPYFIPFEQPCRKWSRVVCVCVCTCCARSRGGQIQHHRRCRYVVWENDRRSGVFFFTVFHINFIVCCYLSCVKVTHILAAGCEWCQYIAHTGSWSLAV